MPLHSVFNELVNEARTRGLHAELHVGRLKEEVGAGYRELTEIRLTRADGKQVVAKRATDWRSLDADAERMLSELARR